ncbi:MAG: DUF4834 family protein [Bacteroidaceae bacterium]|nr:DUF4834 family protein [Bacteroidaceae bacterium]MBP9636809.1 DUF4834 family protein [Bacteroidaceae bacterium]
MLQILFFLILFVLFIGVLLFVVLPGAIMSFLASRLGRRGNPQGGFGSTRPHSSDSAGSTKGESTSQSGDDGSKSKRIFNKSDGEYVDFEEIE